MDFSGIARSVFLDFKQIVMSCHIRSSRVSFARPQAELCLYRFVHCCVVLIDAASRDDSNGGQFVNIDRVP